MCGLAPDDQPTALGLPHNLQLYPVRFESEEVPFPVVGMSDVMPYRSTRWQDLTPEMLTQWRAAFSRQIEQALREFKPDAILTHHVWLLSGLVRELAPDIPMITFCHGTGLRQLDLATQLSDLAVAAAGYLPRIFALTEAQQTTIIERLGVTAGRITITGGAYDQSVFQPPSTPPATDVLRVVYAGKLSFAKGLLPLFDAWDALPDELGARELTLAGSASGEEADAIRRRAAQCRCPVHLPGALPHAQLAGLFGDSHVFVLPSYYEGLPLVLIEALACGLRAVCTDLPGVRDWCGPAVCDRVSWVARPEMQTVDMPLEEAVPAFVTRLTEALAHQLNGAKQRTPLCQQTLSGFLQPRTWEGLFERIADELG